ncbi:ATP-binding protein [Actinophytocola sp.]|uniref:ATP-binding protein n=1 Tax=Actinophytocola sp. TaxID=1872138 RepID=UPI002ED9ACA5
MRLRIGIHTGEVDTDDHGIVGTAVNHVFRLTDAPALKRMLEGSGAALAVITSDRVWEDVIRHAPDLVQPAEYAPVQVEHKETAARAWVRLVGTATAARPRPKEAARSITSFVGRDQELTELHGLIARSRLVTLVGPGGVGKTRLARETLHVLAGEVSTTCADGAYLADLADYRAGDDLCRALLNTLRSSYGPPGRGPTDEALVAALNGRRVLLVLDNCEQILDDVASVAEALLTRTDGTTLLTTSREALGMASETTFSVRPLAVPALDHREHDVRKYAAVQLFVDRAQSADPEFRLTAGNVADVARVCRSLDGLPLPIELAAARVRALTPRQITERLADRFRLLTSGSRTVSRHRTLEAVVDWSHDLLDEPAKEVFAHLAVFRGGFSLSAAEDLADRVGLCRATTADLVVRLVDKSLLQAKPADDGAMRYRMLETLREYAAGRLAERGQVEKARRHHAELYVELAERQSDALRDARQADAVRLLEREDDNLRAAFEWCCRTGNHDLALRLGAALGWYLWMRGDRAFGWAGLARAIDIRSTEQDPVRRVRALIWSCHLGSVGHKAVEPAARVHGRQAKAILEQLGMTRTVEYGYCMFVNAFACYRENQHDDGDAMIARAVYLATELSDPWLMACATIVAGIGHALRGEFADADRRLTESAEHYRGVGDRWGEHRSLIWLSRTNEAVGRLARAEETAVAAYNLVHSLELDGAGAPLLGWIARLRVLRGNEAGAAATLALVEEHRWWRRTSEGVGWISDCQALLIEQRAGAADTAPLRRVVELYGRAATELAAAGLPVHAVYSRCRQALVLARLGAPTAVALDQAAKVANAQADRRALAVVLDTMCLVATDRAAAERLLRLADARWREVGGQRSASFVADLDRLRRGATDPGSGRFSSPL